MSSDLIVQIQELQVRRKFLISLVNKNTNAAGALVRRALGWKYDDENKEKVNKRAASILAAALSGKPQKGDDEKVHARVAPDLALTAQAVAIYDKARHEIELDMKRAARKLPVADFQKQVRGFGELGLAVIVGEAGDLSTYSHIDKIYKRLGLMPFFGKAASTWRREGGLSADGWTALGYSPRRRAELFAVIGDPLFRAQSVGNGEYRITYDKRREKTAVDHPDWSKLRSHYDAQRIMTKALLADLWQAWRSAAGQTTGTAHADIRVSLAAEQVDDGDRVDVPVWDTEKAPHHQLIAAE